MLFGKNQNNQSPIVGALQLYFFFSQRGAAARRVTLRDPSSLAPPTTRIEMRRDGGAPSVLGGGRSRFDKLMQEK